MSIHAMGRVISTAAIASALAACGGGGDTPAPMPQPVAITSENAPSVAAEAINAGGAGLAGDPALTGVQVSAASAPPASAMSALAGAVRKGLTATAPAAVVGATFTETVACTNGGSVTLTVNVATPGTVAAGDRVDFSFANCVEGATTSNGGLSLTYASINGAGTLVVADLAASQFTLSTLGIAGRINGSVRMTLDDTDPTKSVVAVAGSSFTFERLLNGNVRATRTLSNYSYRLETATATLTTSETFDYTASGTFPRIGSVSFRALTIQPVVTLAGALHPSAGTAMAIGASGSSLLFTVLSNGLQLDVDSNGDNVIDVTLIRTWAQIDAEL
ncbi:MAG TPA: hypothetical protein VJ598_02520 [Albitalea sp.]|nr:hypothetical protein [Albitalea sp.]